MGSYTQVITNAGEDLIAQALEGETLIFTEVATSASVIEGTLEMIKAVSELKDIKQTVIPAAATKIGSSTVQVSSTFTNEEITEEYDVQTVGLYAKIGDSEQKLFALAKALKASEMTEKSEGSATSLVFNFNMTIQQASELTISIIPGGALPSEVFYSIFPGLGTPSLDNAKNILQVNAKGTWEYITAEDMKASTDEFGFVKLCDSSAVTDSTGLALPATEKNASIEGTLAYQLSQLNTDLENKIYIEKQAIDVSSIGFNGSEKETLITFENLHPDYYNIVLNISPMVSHVGHHIDGYNYVIRKNNTSFYMYHTLESSCTHITLTVLYFKQ